MPPMTAVWSARVYGPAVTAETYSVDGVDLLPPLIFLPLDPVLIQVIE
jgi:hypothetical protein